LFFEESFIILFRGELFQEGDLGFSLMMKTSALDFLGEDFEGSTMDS
jgi:hypothetical protein